MPLRASPRSDPVSSYPLVLVKWVDIQSHDGPWVDMEEASEYAPVVVETVGWIITDAEDYITLVSTLSDDNTFTGSVCSIPKGCIKSTTPLRGETRETLSELRDADSGGAGGG